MKIKFLEKATLDTLVLVLGENFDALKHFDVDDNIKSLIGEVSRSRRFEGKAGSSVCVATPHLSQIKNIILLGIGKEEDFNSLAAMKLGGRIVAKLKCVKIENAAVLLEDRLVKKDKADIYAHIAYGADLRNYSFDKYKSAEKTKDKVHLESIELITEACKQAQEIYMGDLSPVAESINFSRNLISEPPNVIYPETFANSAKDELEKLGIEVEILGEKQMQDLGMNALLGVGQGSSRESKLLVMQYNGGDKDQAPLAFVGKGVTFDTGGISIKPSNNMEDMKYDMSGAAIVTGLIKALASRKAKVNVVAIAGLAENMPDGNAQRPADVVRSMSGQTIEILNTDAEGRLVLADALWYCQNRFKPQLMIDLATLTGAIIVALGTHQAGLFSNNEKIEKALLEAAKATGEKLWPMPLSDEYDKMVDSVIADVRNTGNGKGAGSTTAAQFLKRFVNNVPWAHLDIAGVSWDEKGGDLAPSGATGFGIRLLNEFISSYEK